MPMQNNNSFIATCAAAALGLAAPMLTGISDAHAVPAFARQTGMECSTCHVGSFGPQLTAFGRSFKLKAYMMNTGQSETSNSKGSSDTPGLKEYLQNLSAMAFGGVEHTDGDLRRGIELAGPQQRLRTNDNTTLDQVSIFYGGPVFSNVGMLAQATYSDPNQHFAWDNTDIRYANDT